MPLTGTWRHQTCKRRNVLSFPKEFEFFLRGIDFLNALKNFTIVAAERKKGLAPEAARARRETARSHYSAASAADLTDASSSSESSRKTLTYWT